MYISQSRSVLRNVLVEGAGRGRFLGKANVTSAVETWGVPPVMDHITVTNSAYNGKNPLGRPVSNIRYFAETIKHRKCWQKIESIECVGSDRLLTYVSRRPPLPVDWSCCFLSQEAMPAFTAVLHTFQASVTRL